MTADQWIERLNLERHPEGGWFRQVYRSADTLAGDVLPARFGGITHPASTAIYFLLRGFELSVLHRLKADELWHFYDGSSLTLHAIAPEGVLSHLRLGRGDVPQFQAVVPAGYWFAATVDECSPDAFTLVGCTVAPGFIFEDFELADRSRLFAQFPQHRALIERLTR